MRLAIVTDTYLPQINGVTTVVRRIVESTRAAGLDVRIVAPDYPGFSPEDARETRLRSVSFPPYPAIRLSLPHYRRLSAFLDRRRPDVVHLPTEGPLGLLGRRYARSRGIPIVTAFHTNFPQYAAHYGHPRLAPWIWRWLLWFHRPAVRTYTPGTAALAELHHRGLSQARLWGCAVDTRRFAPTKRDHELRRDLGASDDTVVVLHVGRLAPEKNLAVLAAAWREAHERLGAAARFVIAGDGPGGPHLDRTLPWARRLGFMDRDALARLYASADICVLPSATETCGLVALEAMASGVPVIAADAGGLRDSIVPGETGILVPPHDASGFAAAITTLALDRERRCAIAATARAWAETRSLGYETARLLDDLHRTVASRDTQRPCTAA